MHAPDRAALEVVGDVALDHDRFHASLGELPHVPAPGEESPAVGDLFGGDDKRTLDAQLPVLHQAPGVRCARYQSIVFCMAASISKRGFHPSRSRALAALRY